MKISEHSINRYIERTRANPNKRTRTENKIKRIIEIGKPIKPKLGALKLINNGFNYADYYLHGNLVAVVSNNTVVTIILYDKSKWVI